MSTSMNTTTNPAAAITDIDFDLTRNAFGHLVLRKPDGETIEGVLPVRAFPIQAPEEGLALMTADGKEVAWIDRLAALPSAIAQLIREELAVREFMPVISRIVHVSSFATPSTWQVDTDRGATEFVLRGEEDLRRIGAQTLLVSDNHGIQFLIRDMSALDKHSRRILDRFM